MKLTYRYRLRPTKRQISLLNEHLEICRSVYNSTLAVRKEAYESRGESMSFYSTSKLLPKWKTHFTDMTKVHSQVLQDVQMRVDRAYKGFFRRVRAGHNPGYPRFKAESRYHSLTYPQYGNGVKLEGSDLKLSKVGTIRVKLHRPVEGAIKTVTIRRDKLGKWFVSFACEVEKKLLEPSPNVVGVDLGLHTFAALSDGRKIMRQRFLKRDKADIARLRRKKDRLEAGSRERKKARRALLHACQRAPNRRDDFCHRQSRTLVNDHQVMVFEDLDILNMQDIGGPVIEENIMDVAWGKFVRYTIYKAENAGRTVVLVDPRNTTKACSGCGTMVEKSLSTRTHNCPSCGLRIDRDLNAARNILARGLASIEAANAATRKSLCS